MTDNEMTTIQISKTNRARLLSHAGLMQAVNGESVSANDVLTRLLDLQDERGRIVSIDELPHPADATPVPVVTVAKG